MKKQEKKKESKGNKRKGKRKAMSTKGQVADWRAHGRIMLGTVSFHGLYWVLLCFASQGLFGALKWTFHVILARHFSWQVQPAHEKLCFSDLRKAVGPNLSSSAAESAELREIVSTAMDY